jgi:hypothetical protein
MKELIAACHDFTKVPRNTDYKTDSIYVIYKILNDKNKSLQTVSNVLSRLSDILRVYQEDQPADSPFSNSIVVFCY